MQNENTLVVVFCVSMLIGIGIIYGLSGVSELVSAPIANESEPTNRQGNDISEEDYTEADERTIREIANSIQLIRNTDYQILIDKAKGQGMEPEIVSRLQALQEVSRAAYLKRNGSTVQETVEGQLQLERLASDSRLTPSQREMVKKLAASN